MRRHDREITDSAKIADIIRACTCCRLGFCDEGEVYIVPLSFGYEECGDERYFYFHSAPEGRKLDLVRKVGRAGFELDTNYMLHTAETACAHSARFQSVIGTGSIEVLASYEDKVHALSCIMVQNTGRGDWDIPRERVDGVAVLRLTVEKLSCKEHA